jgi:hypothetical protein
MIFLLIYIIGSAKNQLASLKGNVFPFVKKGTVYSLDHVQGFPACNLSTPSSKEKHKTHNIKCRVL